MGLFFLTFILSGFLFVVVVVLLKICRNIDQMLPLC